MHRASIKLLLAIINVIISVECKCVLNIEGTLMCQLQGAEEQIYENVETIKLIGNGTDSINITSIKKLIVKSNESTEQPSVSDKLEVLDLQNNKLTNLRNNTFENLTKLEILLFSNNELMHITIPDTIRLLNISDNKINSLINIWGVGSNLEVLNLSNNSLESFNWNIFENCLKLQTLNINNNKITQLISDNITQLVDLVQLYLSGNKLTSLPPDFLSNTIDLKLLDLSHNQINKIENNSLQKLNNLIHLNLSYNRLDLLDKHTFPYQLTIIDLSHNEITHINPGLFSLEYLSQVYLNDNKIKYFKDDTFVFQYPGFASKIGSKIKKLDIKNNNVTVLTEKFFFVLKHLEWFDFVGNPWFCDNLTVFIRYLNKKPVEYNKIGYFEGELPNCVKENPGGSRTDDWYRKKYFDKLATYNTKIN